MLIKVEKKSKIVIQSPTNNVLSFYRCEHVVNSLCMVAVQAYAELDRWQEVLPFVTQLYNGIEDCPVQVVRLWYVL